jgi:hypothetical protein
LLDVERGCVLWIFGLNENIGAKGVCHCSLGVPDKRNSKRHDVATDGLGYAG